MDSFFSLSPIRQKQGNMPLLNHYRMLNSDRVLYNYA